MATLDEKRERLLEFIRRFDSCVVAFSGGVDSALVAKAAQVALGEKAVAVTAVSASVAAGELEQARQVARSIGIRHEVIETGEFENPAYTQNAPDRCFHCKSELYTQLEHLTEKFAAAVVFNGANIDDAGDYRPGAKAAQQHAVRSPLAECGLSKSDVRELARAWDLPVWDKPATPCLSSRVAYGEEVTPERLHRIDQAERLLRSLGLDEVRVRYHRGDLARLEVPLTAIERLASEPVRGKLAAELKRLGFKYVTLDLEGFRSGSQNAVLPVVRVES